jgi:hypothetical protein
MIQHQQQPSLYGQVEDLPSGHGRRTSINVKGHGGGNYGSISGYGLPSDWSEEGYGVVGPHQGQYGSMSGMSTGGHSRQGSRAGQMDGSWRISKLSFLPVGSFRCLVPWILTVPRFRWH